MLNCFPLSNLIVANRFNFSPKEPLGPQLARQTCVVKASPLVFSLISTHTFHLTAIFLQRKFLSGEINPYLLRDRVQAKTPKHPVFPVIAILKDRINNPQLENAIVTDFHNWTTHCKTCQLLREKRMFVSNIYYQEPKQVICYN